MPQISQRTLIIIAAIVALTACVVTGHENAAVGGGLVLFWLLILGGI